MQSHHFANKDLYNQSYGLSSDHVQVWELDTSHTKEGWALKNWCFQIVMLEKALESPLDSRKIKAFNSKGNQLWIFIGRADVEAEAPILWPYDSKSQITGKVHDAGKDWGQEEKGCDRGWDGWIASPTQWVWVWANWEIMKDREVCPTVVHGVKKSQTQLSYWTTTTTKSIHRS